MSNKQSEEKTVKVVVKRRIWMGEADDPRKIEVGTVVEMTEEMYDHFGEAVSKDIPKKK